MAAAAPDWKATIDEISDQLKKKGSLNVGIERTQKLINEELQRIEANGGGAINRVKFQKIITAIVKQIKDISKEYYKHYIPKVEQLSDLCECLLLILTPQNIKANTIDEDFKRALKALMNGIKSSNILVENEVQDPVTIKRRFERYSRIIAKLNEWLAALEQHRIQSHNNPKFSYNDLFKEYVNAIFQLVDPSGYGAPFSSLYKYNRNLDLPVIPGTPLERCLSNLYNIWMILLKLDTSSLSIGAMTLSRIEFISILPDIALFNNLDQNQKHEFIQSQLNYILQTTCPPYFNPGSDHFLNNDLNKMGNALTSLGFFKEAFQILDRASKFSNPATHWWKGTLHIKIIMLALTKQIKELNGVDSKQFKENLLAHLQEARCLNDAFMNEYSLGDHFHQSYFQWSENLFNDLVICFEQQEYNIVLEILKLMQKFINPANNNLNGECRLLQAACLVKLAEKKESKEEPKVLTANIIENVQKALALLNAHPEYILSNQMVAFTKLKLSDFLKACREYLYKMNEFQACSLCNQFLLRAYSVPQYIQLPPYGFGYGLVPLPILQEQPLYDIFEAHDIDLQVFLNSGNYQQSGDNREALTTQLMIPLLEVSEKLKAYNKAGRAILLEKAAIQLLNFGLLLSNLKDYIPANACFQRALELCDDMLLQLRIKILLRYTLSLSHSIVNQKEQKIVDEAAHIKSIQDKEMEFFKQLNVLIDLIVSFPIDAEDVAKIRHEISELLLKHQSNPVLTQNMPSYLVTMELSFLCLGLNPPISQLLFDSVKHFISTCLSLPMNVEFDEIRKRALMYVQRFQKLFSSQKKSAAIALAPNFLLEKFLGMLQKFEIDLNGKANEQVELAPMDTKEDSESDLVMSGPGVGLSPFDLPTPIFEDAQFNAAFLKELRMIRNFKADWSESFSTKKYCILAQELYTGNIGFLSQVVHSKNVNEVISYPRLNLFYCALFLGNLNFIKLLISKDVSSPTMGYLTVREICPVALSIILGHRELLKYLLSLKYSFDSLKTMTCNGKLLDTCEAKHLTTDPEILSMAEASKEMLNLFTFLPEDGKDKKEYKEHVAELKSRLDTLSRIVTPLQTWGNPPESALMKCIRAGNLELLKLLLELPLDWKYHLDIGLNHIHLCPIEKIKECVLFLKQYTDNPARLAYLLPVALEWGDLELFSWFQENLECGFEGRSPVSQRTCLQVAIFESNSYAVDYIFQELPHIKQIALIDCFKKADPALAANEQGHVPFIMAVILKRKEIIKKFLKAYAGDPQLLDAITPNEGHNALLAALGVGSDIETITDLIQAGVNLHRHFTNEADLKATVERLRIPDSIAAKIKAACQLFQVLIFNNPLNPPSLEVIKKLLKEGAFLTQRAGDGLSPLHIIAEKYQDLFSDILELEEFENEVISGQGASLLTMTDNQGRTPRMVAEQHGFVAIVFLCTLHSARFGFVRYKNRIDAPEIYQGAMEVLIAELHQLSDESQRVKYYFKLGKYFEETFGDYSNAKRYLKLYLKLSGDRGDLREAAHYYLALAYFNSGKLATLESVMGPSEEPAVDDASDRTNRAGLMVSKVEVSDSKAAADSKAVAEKPTVAKPAEVTGLDDDDVPMPAVLKRELSAHLEEPNEVKTEIELPVEVEALHHFDEARDYKDASFYRKFIFCSVFKETFGYETTDVAVDPLEKLGKLKIYAKIYEIEQRLRAAKSKGLSAKSNRGIKRKHDEIEEAREISGSREILRPPLILSGRLPSGYASENGVAPMNTSENEDVLVIPSSGVAPGTISGPGFGKDSGSGSGAGSGSGSGSGSGADNATQVVAAGTGIINTASAGSGAETVVITVDIVEKDSNRNGERDRKRVRFV